MSEARGFGACAAFHTRRAARLVGALYDRVLESTGLTSAQFSALAALAALGPLPITGLAHRLGVDRTTLTRNLERLGRRGMIRFAPGTDQRVRLVEATAEGREAFARAAPVWRSVQEDLLERFGPERWLALKEELRALADVAGGAASR